MSEAISSLSVTVSSAPAPMPVPVPMDNRTARHILRTLVQVLVAIAVGIPASAAAFGLSAATTGKITGAIGLLVIVVTTLQNAGESIGIIPTILSSPVTAWVQQQIGSAGAVSVGPTISPSDVATSIVTDSSTDAPVIDPVPGDVQAEPGTPGAGNEMGMKAPKKTTAKKTANARRTSR